MNQTKRVCDLLLRYCRGDFNRSFKQQGFKLEGYTQNDIDRAVTYLLDNTNYIKQSFTGAGWYEITVPGEDFIDADGFAGEERRANEPTNPFVHLEGVNFGTMTNSQIGHQSSNKAETTAPIMTQQTNSIIKRIIMFLWRNIWLVIAGSLSSILAAYWIAKHSGWFD